jgi:hypothetical protein
LLGQDRSSSETTDKLLAALRTPSLAALIDEDRASDIAVTAGNDAAAVNVRQHITAIAYRASALCLLTSSSRSTPDHRMFYKRTSWARFHAVFDLRVVLGRCLYAASWINIEDSASFFNVD